MLKSCFRYRQICPNKAARGLSLALLILLSACSERVPPPVVEANGETLEGLWVGEDGNVAAFRGVPFAAPPVGDLRWRMAQPSVPRDGRQDATEFAPACIQTSEAADSYARIAAAFGHGPDAAAGPKGFSEDCLYLNIWSPRLDPAAKLPVMVWVHGGMNSSGWSYEPEVLGDRLAARGVVVVSIAYRLGPLGFFAHPVLDNGEGEPLTNFGWLDIRQAFRWVRRNIEEFGGDPENITGFGQDSGAGNLLDWALAGDNSEGLFRRLILQSSLGSLNQRRTLADEQAIGGRLLAGVGLDGNITSRRLRELSAQDLLDAGSSELKGHRFAAAVDGLTMIRQPIEALPDTQSGNLEILIGTNADEWYLYLDPATGQQDVISWINDEAPEFAGSLQSEVAAETDPRKALDRLMTARDSLCPSRDAAAAISAQGGQAYVYYFKRVRPGAGGLTAGAYHGAETPYVFDRHDNWLPIEQVDRDLTSAMEDYWVQFARNGDPGIRGRPGWPTYVSGRPYVMEFGQEIAVAEPHDAALCRYLGIGRAQ